ncbi:RNA polymerase sigma-70 factor (ECF subfamily) [Tahibacter aquaticus]|uniref:RNA polymerase sigma-70 factor (ECF subfamily) n=1 Tax=Tahibacter aquaticus TaxID=520092 RepID=A0A4R6YWB1_9GAMM|nr:sigma-70 family RNA polymerase sigma factor [Tahibacter aquaticus]TDR43051.1 RNA polymerase sigma-70 factor (ECF subfamily) [Tahibacter aquaticus]
MLAIAVLETGVTEHPGTDAPAALARHYGALVFRAAFRILGDAALAEDVQQDVFLRLLEQPPSDVASWPAYLTAAAVRRAIDRQRQQRRWWRVLPVWRAQAPQSAASAEDAGLSDERARRLRAAMAELSPREAQCFSLRYLEGMAIDDIARVLAITSNTTHVTLHRARRRLEARLGDAVTEAMP